jgi:hypothetical protein
MTRGDTQDASINKKNPQTQTALVNIELQLPTRKIDHLCNDLGLSRGGSGHESLLKASK